ncbi:MAG: hypothetical protein JKY01_07275 [Pseudomonadales bacterium]|nr:hypothetical protein [Pseudomonadales bacterium]
MISKTGASIGTPTAYLSSLKGQTKYAFGTFFLFSKNKKSIKAQKPLHQNILDMTLHIADTYLY